MFVVGGLSQSPVPGSVPTISFLEVKAKYMAYPNFFSSDPEESPLLGSVPTISF